MMELGLGKLAKNATSVFTSRLVVGLLHLISIAIIARVYGPAGNGAYAVLLLLPSMLTTFLNLGIGPANVYYLGSAQVSLARVLSTNIKITIVLSLIGLTFGGSLIWLKSDGIFPGIDPFLLWLALFSFPVSLMQSFISSMFQGMQQFREFNIMLLTKPLVTLIIIIALVLSGEHNLDALIFAYLASVTITLFVSLFLLQKYLKNDKGDLNKDYTRKAINYGYKAHLSNIMAFANYKADIFLVNLLLNPASTGIYVISVQLGERLWMLSQAVSTVLLPRLSELSNDDEKRLQITPFITRLTLYSTAVMCLGFAVIAYPLIPLIFGMQYLDAYTPLIILLPGIVLTTTSRILANDLAARGMPQLNMYTSIIVLVCNVVGNIVLIPKYGLSGAALATTMAYMINYLLKLLQYNYITAVPVKNLVIISKNDLKRLFSFVKIMMRKVM